MTITVRVTLCILSARTAYLQRASDDFVRQDDESVGSGDKNLYFPFYFLRQSSQ